MQKAPKLKLKAAEGRHLLPILQAMLVHCFDNSSEHNLLRLRCVNALCACYEEMERWNDNGTSARKLGEHARHHLILYNELSTQAGDPLLWRLYPKHHQFLRIAENSATNPRDEWNYSDESEIGDACRIARGVNAAHISTKLLERYRIIVRSSSVS